MNNNGALLRLLASSPAPVQIALLDAGLHIAYYLHQEQDNPNVLTGTAIMKLDGLCPPFDPANNSNLFRHYFGIKLVHDGHTYMRSISPFEFASCLCLTDKLRFKLSQPQHLSASTQLSRASCQPVCLTRSMNNAFIFDLATSKVWSRISTPPQQRASGHF